MRFFVLGSREAAVVCAAASLMTVSAGLSAAAQEPPPPGVPGPGPQEMMHGRPGDGHGPEGMHGGGPLSELAHAEADQVASQAVAGLARAQLADVQRTVRTSVCRRRCVTMTWRLKPFTTPWSLAWWHWSGPPNSSSKSPPPTPTASWTASSTTVRTRRRRSSRSVR